MHAVAELLRESPFFAYYILSKDYRQLLIENEHNQVLAGIATRCGRCMNAESSVAPPYRRQSFFVLIKSSWSYTLFIFPLTSARTVW